MGVHRKVESEGSQWQSFGPKDMKLIGGKKERIKESLLGGTYEPQAVKQVEVPKSSGGTRKLGVPTVLDRLIQQAILQILSPIFEPGFSEYSFGF